MNGNSLHKRLIRELQIIYRKPLPFFMVNPHPYEWLRWNAELRGPDGGPYKGGVFQLTITFPTTYPFEPPVVRFRTKIHHWAVSSKGRVHLPIIESGWKSSNSVKNVFRDIYVALTQQKLLVYAREEFEQFQQEDISFNIYFEHFLTEARDSTERYAITPRA